MLQPGEPEQACELARRRSEGCDAILLVLGADDDCPKEVAPELLTRGQDASGGLPFSVVLAKSEFQAWFLGSLKSLRDTLGITETAVSPEHPEGIRDASASMCSESATPRRRSSSSVPGAEASSGWTRT